MTRDPTATGSGDSSATTELGERDEVVITVAELSEATSLSTILSDDDDALKPRYRPGDVIIDTVSMYRGKPKALDVERDVPVPAVTVAPPAPPAPLTPPTTAPRRVGRVRWFDVARKYGFIVPLDGAPDVFLHLRDLDPGVAEALEELAVVSYDVVPYRDKTKAVRLQIVDAAAYAQLVLENQGRTLSVQDAAVELGRLRAIPLPPRAGEERV